MASLKLFFFLVFLRISFLPPVLTVDDELCDPVLCDVVLVDYPFRLTNQPHCCGDPNFNLSISCINGDQLPAKTIINLPLSGEFTVDSIDYWSTPPYVEMSDSCMPERILEGLDLSNTPFQPLYPDNFTFFNCSSDSDASEGFPAIRFYCLSGKNFSVWGIPSVAYNQSSSGLSLCVQIAKILVPLPTSFLPQHNLTSVALTWEQPYCPFPPCNHCGSDCQPENGDDECSVKKRGLSNRIRYSLILAVGTPVILIGVCITIYKLRVSLYYHHSRPNVEIAGLNAEPRLPAAVAVNGLDCSRIESYPMNMLGEKFKLPRADDNTCSICLSEYQAKETIRTIPDCDHYFHSRCIDEWLMLNAACPICRNMPDDDNDHLITPFTLSSSN
ncbi:putative RING-H2 finger protein ATL21A [Hibiscus syriacus]|nr:putative RING-H2 finger protein ATL21A [Hibiscus syriacus]